MTSSSHRLGSHAQTSRFFILSFKHVLLSILSLGWYRFFTKTEIRRYIWGTIRLDNEPFEYTGTGKELLIGFLKALGFAAIAYPLFLVLTWLASGVFLVAVWIAFIVGVYFLTQMVTYGALRYRLTRTIYRGVRFDLVGSSRDFAVRSFLNFLLVVATFGFYAPIARVKKSKYVVNNMRYGNQTFQYDDSAEPPYASFIWAYFLTVPTLGLCWFWYNAAMTKHIIGNISLCDLRLSCDKISGGKLVKLFLSNLAILACSFGILFPLTNLRALRFVLGELEISGELEFSEVKQTVVSTSATSEGMVELLELELG